MKNRPSDIDADFDPIRSMCQEAFQPGPSDREEPPLGRATNRDGRDRLTATHGFTKNGAAVGQDTLKGLANYFVRSCPPLSWDTSLELGNYKALIALMATFKRDLEMTPHQIRSFIDFYFASLQGRRPKRAYMWDFKGRYHTLLARFEISGVAATADDYTGWQAPAATDQEMQDALAAAQAARARKAAL